MATHIRLLLIEDSESDAELLRHHLENAGLKVSSERVENGKSLTTALETKEWDIIISDFSLSGFNAFDALTILKETGKDFPLIIVSGTINEEKAIDLLRMGASDYMMKDQLARLVPAIKREIEEAQTRRHNRDAEENLRNANERYKILFEQSPFGVLIVDSDTTLPVEFNETAHKQLGYSREEFYKIPISAFEAIESPLDVKARIDLLYKTGKEEFNTLQRTKQGEIRNVHVILRLMDITGKKLQHCIFQDTTEKIKAESDLRESEAAFGDIFQTVNDGIAYTTFTGEVLTVNNALTKILGKPKEEIIGKNILTLAKTLLSGNILEHVLSILINLLKGQEIAPFEVEYQNKILEVSTLINRQSQHLTGVIRDITGQKMAEQKIQKNEARLSAMVSNITDVIAILDEDGTITYKSPNIEKFFGWKPEEMIGKSGFITVHPDDLPGIKANFEILLKSENQPLTMEYRYLCKDGSDRLVKLTAINLAKNPDINGILLNYHDISERRQMELAMAKTEEKFRKAFMTSPDSINLNRLLDGLYLEVNDGFLVLTGYTREEVIGKSSLELNIWANPEDRQRLVKGLREDGKVVNLEAQFRAKDGTIITCLMSANLIEINGEVCILNITRDITDRLKLGLELSKAEEKFRKAFETSPDWISITRIDDGLFIDFNPGFLEFSGYSKEEIIGKTSKDIKIWVNPEDRVRLVKELRENGKVVNMEALFRIKDGSIKTCLVSANIVEFNGETCIITIVRDISDRKKAEEAIQVQSAALDAAATSVTITNAEDRITWANKAFYELTGYSEEESLGHRIFELISSGLHDQAFQENIKQTIYSGKTWHGEIINRRKNGELYTEESTVTPLFGKDGKISHFITVKQDISEKKLNADIMRSRVHLLEFAVNHNLDELLKETLKEAENLTGSLIGFYHFLENDETTINLQAWSTRTVEQYCTVETNESHYPIEKAGVWVDCVRERRPVIHNDYSTLPHRNGMPSGHASLIRELAVPVFRDNKIVALLGVGNKVSDYTKQDVEIVARLADLTWDVAEKKISDNALFESEQHYREIVTDLDKAQSFAHLGSWTWDIQHNQLTWSDEMFRIFGIDRSTFTGRLDDVINQSIHPEDRQKVEESNRMVAEEGNPIPLEYRIIRPDQTIRTVWAEAGEMENDAHGTPLRLSGIVQDITERKIIEERVEAERELLNLCNQADTIKNLASSITAYLKELTNCEAVGMRMHQGDDFPFFETSGYPASFVEKENHLCATDFKGNVLQDSEGNPILECICGMVLQGNVNINKPYFTPNGSYWTNSTKQTTVSLINDEKEIHFRNQCNRAGYESVALVPIRQKSKTYGLVQFIDKRKGHFSPERIELLEHLANFVAIALAKLESDAALIESEKRYKDLFEHAAIPNLLEDFSGVAKIFAEIRKQGVTDMRSHFNNHPELVDQCAQLINILDVNQACVDFFKVSKKEDLFIKLPSFFTETSWGVFRDEIIALAEGEENFECDISARTAAGEEKQINLRLSVDPEYSRTLSRVMVSFVDVTERKRTETALEKRVLALTQPMENGGKIAFDDLFNLEEIQKIQDEFARATGVASIITQPDGTPITRPSNFCRLCNDIIRKTEKGQLNCFKSDAIIGRQNEGGPIMQPCISGGLWDAGAGISVGGQHVANWLIGQVRDETQTEDKMLEYAREIGTDETEFIKAFHEVTPMSQERFKQISETLFTFANQLSTMAYQNVQQARFISDRNRAESALKNTEVHFQSLIENAPDGIALVDQNGRFKYVSPSGRKNFGYEVGEEINYSPDELTHPDDLPAVMEVLNKVIQDPTAKQRIEYRFRHKKGTYIWIESTFTNLFHVPSVEAIIINFRDITARREAEIKIQEQLDELRRWHENTLGREMRVIELKDEVNQALKQAGQPLRYASNSQMEQKHE